MPTNITTQAALKLTTHQLDLMRVAEHANQRVRATLIRLGTDIANALRRADLTEHAISRLTTLQHEVAGMIAMTYRELNALSIATLDQLVRAESKIAATILNRLMGVDLLTGVLPVETISQLVTGFLVQGAPTEDWWERQSAKLLFDFEREVRFGMISNETNQEIVARIIGTRSRDGIMETARHTAEALVRTSVQEGANKSRLAMYRKNSDVIAGVQQISTLDLRTTDICMAYDHQCWDLDGEPIRGTTLPFNGGPPRHWNCRSTLIPILFSWRELGVDGSKIKAGTRASMDGQVSAEINFDTWLASLSKSEQNAVLGKGRAELWRNGKIKLADLLDRRGDPLSLDELLDRYK